MPKTEGYIKKLSTEGLCMIPTEVGGSASTYFPDYLYRNPADTVGLRVRAAGGRACNGATAGPFATGAYYTAALAYASCSSPLCVFVDDPTIEA